MLEGVTLLQEISDMLMRTLQGRTLEGVVLYHVDQGWLDFPVVCLNSRHNHLRSGYMVFRDPEVSQFPVSHLGNW